jgi:aminoglycoside phosphotransferase (APT) family kinase protein
VTHRVTVTGNMRLRDALADAGIGWDEVTDRGVMAGGTFNSVTRVTLASGTRLVVKIPPDPQTPLLSYERGILGTEALFYQLAGRLPGVTLPEVLAVDAAGGHLVMTECPGGPWPGLHPRPAGQERDELRAELGRQVASLHTITGTGFGYPAAPFGPLRDSWREAFCGIVDGILADAERFAVTLPRPAAEVRDLFEVHAGLLDEVTTPVLTHFDLWDGNILVAAGPGGRRVSALIDAERAFWGDPLADFVSLGLFHDIQQDSAFLRGYRDAGGKIAFDAAERERIALYRAYLHLIMWIEAVPRQYDAPRLAWLRGFAFDPLAETLDRWEASPA